MEKKEMIVPDELVISKIYYVREQKVMLDRDLAELYGVQPKRLREQVKRNSDRFPGKFMFQLTEDEVDGMVSQIAIPSKQALGGHLPYVFTEHGVLMLANVLRSKTAIQVSIRIVEIFVKMREMLSTNKDILLKLEQLEKQTMQNTYDVQTVLDYIKQFLVPVEQVERRMIGFQREDQDQ